VFGAWWTTSCAATLASAAVNCHTSDSAIFRFLRRFVTRGGSQHVICPKVAHSGFPASALTLVRLVTIVPQTILPKCDARQAK
jgi:hypothetical protein